MKLPKIERLPSGSYRAQVQINGQRHSVTGATEKEVEREVAALKLQLKKAPIPANALTLSEAIDRYIETRTNVLSPSTIRGYRIIQRHRFQSLMPVKVKELTKEACQRAINDAKKQYSGKTVSNSWGFVGTVIEEFTGERPDVTIGQITTKQREFLEPDEIRQFIEIIKGDIVEIPALLALSSLRRSEILVIDPTVHFDYNKRLIRVSGSMVQDEHNKMVVKKENKSKVSSRIVPMIDPLYEAVLPYKGVPGKIVTLTCTSITRRINALCEANGLPRVGLHGLRHSFASLAYSLGMPEKITMEIGGWSNDGTMKRIYTHVAQKDRAHYESEFTSFFTPESKNAHENAHEIPETQVSSQF